MSEFETMRLGELLKFQNGRLSPERFERGKFCVYGSNGVIGRADSSNAPGPSVVIGRVGSYCGSVYFAKEDCWVTDNAIQARGLESMDNRYLYYLTLHTGLNNWRTGSGQPLLNQSTLSAIPVQATKDELEQRAIARVLGALDDKIESNRRQQSTLLGICHTAFDVALLNGADVMKVEDMVRFRNNERKPLSAMDRAGMERCYPYYGATGVFDYVDAYLFDDVNILIGEDGSVVNDDGTPVAQMAWGKYWVNNHAHVLSGKAVSTELAYIALARSDVRPLITGAVQLKINMGNLKSLEVALPSVEVRDDVNREIQENLALWRAKSDESKMLVSLRDALLPELLSGRLRVKDAESMMANA